MSAAPPSPAPEEIANTKELLAADLGAGQALEDRSAEVASSASPTAGRFHCAVPNLSEVDRARHVYLPKPPLRVPEGNEPPSTEDK